jgi:gamma-glutamyl-gamma-aminobutyrate hydrolase PuuD
MKVLLPLSKVESKTCINTAYVDYIEEAGFNPILVGFSKQIDFYISQADALILPGGIDVDPTYYGMDNKTSYSVDREKDDFERKLLYASVQKGIPIFGICRGHQLLAYEVGVHNKHIKVSQHVNNHNQSDYEIERKQLYHRIYYSDSLYNDGSDDITNKMFVNSMHHQTVITSVPGIGSAKQNVEKENTTILAFTERGAYQRESKKQDLFLVVEAMMIRDIRAISVQWHPEELKDYNLLVSVLTRWS